MIERIKIRLRDLDIDFYKYEDGLSPLYYKARYMNEDCPRYSEQISFDESLDLLKIVDPFTHGPNLYDFENALSNQRLTIEGFSIVGAKNIPGLDENCGKNFKFRDLIECGETWQRIRIDNTPKYAESYNALYLLAVNLLDPLIDYFGMIRLTYGFSSIQLTRQIRTRIAPSLDQHAACELNRLGKLVCSRKGAAVDFVVEDEDMLEVARWIVANLPFDRLYFYGPTRPLHLSYGPDVHRQVTIMLPSQNGSARIYPKNMKHDEFFKLVWSDKRNKPD